RFARQLPARLGIAGAGRHCQRDLRGGADRPGLADVAHRRPVPRKRRDHRAAQAAEGAVHLRHGSSVRGDRRGAPAAHHASARATARRRRNRAVIEALVGFAAIFFLALLRMPLAFAMGLVGFAGIAVTRGLQPALASTAQVVYETGFAYTLSVIPLFILMGNFVARAGLAHELFQAAYAFIGHVRGGLAHATIAACAGFGAICGSSIATAATMGKVAYPSMSRLGYSNELSMGVIAAGGTLGIMIPPSTIMVIYGITTETNIGKLFAAGVIPGVL